MHFQEIQEEEEDSADKALFYCFEVKDRVEDEWWRLCAHDQLEGTHYRLTSFRKALIKRVITHLEKVNGMSLEEKEEGGKEGGKESKAPSE